MVEMHVNNAEENAKTDKTLHSTVLDNFFKITKGKEKVRVKGGTSLVKYLANCKRETEGELEINYAIKRLIRGLGSSNLTAKTGFYSTLTALLTVDNHITLKQVNEVAALELQTSGSNSKSEKGEIYSGQVLLYGAVIRSGLFLKCSSAEQFDVIKSLVNAGERRSYLTLLSFTFVIQLLEHLSEDEFETLVLSQLTERLSKSWDDVNCVYFLFEAHKRFPNVVNRKFLRKCLGANEIVCPASLENFCRVLVTPVLENSTHPIYEVFARHVSNSEHLTRFFEIVDASLEKSNVNKLVVVTKILRNVVEYLGNRSVLPQIFTNNYLRHILTYLRSIRGKIKNDVLLNELHQLFDAVLVLLKFEPENAPKLALIRKFLFPPGAFTFEKLTRSKIVQLITAQLDDSAVKSLAQTYKKVAFADAKFEDRIYAAEMLVKLLMHASVLNDLEWRNEQLTSLARVGVLEEPDVNDDLAKFFRESFYRGLNHKLPKLNDVRQMLSSVFRYLTQAESKPRKPLDTESTHVLKKTDTLVRKLENKKDNLKSVFHVLFLRLGVLLYDDQKLAADSLNELLVCYERVKESDTTDLTWMQVTTDLFLNLLSHNSHLLRNLVVSVFPHLCEYVDEDVLGQILAVLDPENNDSLMTAEDESDSNDDDSDFEENEEETVNEKLRTAVREALSLTDEESVDMDEVDEEERNKLDEKLAEAFKRYTPNLGRSKKQTKSDETLMHFRIRVLDLLEVYLESGPPIRMVLELMQPLLKALEFCVREAHQTALVHRLRVCLKKLTSLKKNSQAEEFDGNYLSDLLHRVLSKDTKNTLVVQEMGDKISDCVVFLVKCSGNAGKKEGKRIRKIISQQLEDFFTRRDSLVSYSLFCKLFSMRWDGNSELVDKLIEHAFNENVRNFRQTQSLQLLTIFLTKNKDSACLNVKNVSDKTVEFFEESNRTNATKKGKFLCSLFTFLVALRKNSAEGSCDVDWERIGGLAQVFRGRVNFSANTKHAYQKLCSVLGLEMKKNRSVERKEAEVDVTDVVKKEKHKSKEVKKERKERKKKNLLRLQSSSEGLEDAFSFTNVQFDEEIGNGTRKRKIKGENGLPEVKVAKKS